MVLIIVLVVLSICYHLLEYLGNVIPLFLVLINLIIIHKSLKTHKKKYEFWFLTLFPFGFVLILLSLLFDIPLSILIAIKGNVYQPFFWFNNISIFLILGIIILIFVNWNFICKNNIKNDDKYIQLYKDLYSILTLVTTLVVAIINLGFDKGNQLGALNEFNIISIPLVGYLICSILEFINKHSLTIRDIKKYKLR